MEETNNKLTNRRDSLLSAQQPERSFYSVSHICLSSVIDPCYCEMTPRFTQSRSPSPWWPAVRFWSALTTASSTSLLLTSSTPARHTGVCPRTVCSLGGACPSPRYLRDQLLLFSVVPTSAPYFKMPPSTHPVMPNLITLLSYFSNNFSHSNSLYS